MDFTWTPEQVELRERAHRVAHQAVSAYGRQNDSWINGFSKDFAKEMAAQGWIGMTWPKEFGGGGRPPIERLIVGEEMIRLSVGLEDVADLIDDLGQALRSAEKV